MKTFSLRVEHIFSFTAAVDERLAGLDRLIEIPLVHPVGARTS